MTLLYSFISDTDATLRLFMPQAYRYKSLVAGIVLYCGASYFTAFRNTRSKF
jgi:hypothetical protein